MKHRGSLKQTDNQTQGGEKKHNWVPAVELCLDLAKFSLDLKCELLHLCPGAST